MAVHSLEATFRGAEAVRARPIIVRTRRELAEALSQRERAVIIEDETMARIVGVFERVQKWWIPAAVIAYSISQAYQVEFSRTVWQVGRTVQDKLILKPTKTRAPKLPAGGEE
jgi:hypothetical protein